MCSPGSAVPGDGRRRISRLSAVSARAMMHLQYQRCNSLGTMSPPTDRAVGPGAGVDTAVLGRGGPRRTGSASSGASPRHDRERGSKRRFWLDSTLARDRFRRENAADSQRRPSRTVRPDTSEAISASSARFTPPVRCDPCFLPENGIGLRDLFGVTAEWVLSNRVERS